MRSEYGMIGTISDATAKYLIGHLQFLWKKKSPFVWRHPWILFLQGNPFQGIQWSKLFSILVLYFLKYLDNLKKMLLHIFATVAPFSDQAGHLCVFFIGFCIITHCRCSEEQRVTFETEGCQVIVMWGGSHKIPELDWRRMSPSFLWQEIYRMILNSFVGQYTFNGLTKNDALTNVRAVTTFWPFINRLPIGHFNVIYLFINQIWCFSLNNICALPCQSKGTQ